MGATNSKEERRALWAKVATAEEARLLAYKIMTEFLETRGMTEFLETRGDADPAFGVLVIGSEAGAIALRAFKAGQLNADSMLWGK